MFYDEENMSLLRSEIVCCYSENYKHLAAPRPGTSAAIPLPNSLLQKSSHSHRAWPGVREKKSIETVSTVFPLLLILNRVQLFLRQYKTHSRGRSN